VRDKILLLIKGRFMKNVFLILITLLNLAGTAWSQTLNDTFAEGNVTDQQAKDAKEFVHQGLRDAAVQSGCSQEGLGDCNQSSVDRQGTVMQGDFGQALEQNIGRLYGMLGVFTGNKVKVVDKADAASVGTKDASGNTIKKKDVADEKMDYCMLAAQGYEIVSGSIQQSLQGKITEEVASEKDEQVKSLLALQKTHEARAKTSSYQSAIYAATGTCYIARAAASQGRVVMDANYWIKMSASIALSGLYLAKVKKHKDAALLVKGVIDSLPTVGSCNPWTKTECFCGEKTSKTTYPDIYEQVCVIQKGNPNPPQMAMACGVLKDGKMTIDKECKCKQTKTCFTAKINPASVNFKLGSNFMNQANKGFDLLGSGEFDQGQFDSYSLQSGVYANKVKGKIATPANITLPKLSKQEQAIADSLKNFMSPQAAAIAARSPSAFPSGAAADSGVRAALSKVPEKLKDKVGATEPLKYKSGGAGFGGTEAAEPEVSFQLPGAGGVETQEGTEVLTFAEKAMNDNADVSNAPDTPIFDIISNRYMRSGWNKLQGEEQK
jgi:hypothetical protein